MYNVQDSDCCIALNEMSLHMNLWTQVGILSYKHMLYLERDLLASTLENSVMIGNQLGSRTLLVRMFSPIDSSVRRALRGIQRFFPPGLHGDGGINAFALWLTKITIPFLGIFLFGSNPITSKDLLAYCAIEYFLTLLSMISSLFRREDRLLESFFPAIWFLLVIVAMVFSAAFVKVDDLSMEVAIATVSISILASYTGEALSTSNITSTESLVSTSGLEWSITSNDTRRRILKEALFRKRLKRLEDVDPSQLTDAEWEEKTRIVDEWLEEYEDNDQSFSGEA